MNALSSSNVYCPRRVARRFGCQRLVFVYKPQFHYQILRNLDRMVSVSLAAGISSALLATRGIPTKCYCILRCFLALRCLSRSIRAPLTTARSSPAVNLTAATRNMIYDYGNSYTKRTVVRENVLETLAVRLLFHISFWVSRLYPLVL